MEEDILHIKLSNDAPIGNGNGADNKNCGRLHFKIKNFLIIKPSKLIKAYDNQRRAFLHPKDHLDYIWFGTYNLANSCYHGKRQDAKYHYEQVHKTLQP